MPIAAASQRNRVVMVRAGLLFNSTRRKALEALKKEDLVQLEGGGAPGTACGAAVAFNLVMIAVSPLFALYLASKTIGVCAIEAAVT